MNVAYDIDGCLANFRQAVLSAAQFTEWRHVVPVAWDSLRDIKTKQRFVPDGLWDIIIKDRAFWKSIPAHAGKLSFLPVTAYVTKREFPDAQRITEAWLRENGFPEAPVLCVPMNQSKVPILKALNIDVFVEDAANNWQEINDAGITCFLVDRPWNRAVNAGYQRIHNFDQLRFQLTLIDKQERM
jgi:hypothetical protein